MAREYVKEIRLSDYEKAQIEDRARACGMNVSEYIRVMCICGEISVYDMSQVRWVNVELSRLGSNINQIIKLANTNGSISQGEIDEVKKQLETFLEWATEYKFPFKRKVI